MYAHHHQQDPDGGRPWQVWGAQGGEGKAWSRGCERCLGSEFKPEGRASQLAVCGGLQGVPTARHRTQTEMCACALACLFFITSETVYPSFTLQGPTLSKSYLKGAHISSQ